jgi:hypothetical protein
MMLQSLLLKSVPAAGASELISQAVQCKQMQQAVMQRGVLAGQPTLMFTEQLKDRTATEQSLCNPHSYCWLVN